MKLLVFEYICGGGLNGQPLPASLRAEGALMLRALLAELDALDAVELQVLLDARCADLPLPPRAVRRVLQPGETAAALLPQMLQSCDAFWPIAPETDGVLRQLAAAAQAAGVALLASTPEAIALCGDKLACGAHLARAGLPCAEGRLPADSTPWPGRQVVKLRDGVGCQEAFVLEDAAAFLALRRTLDDAQRYLHQPYYAGRAVSLSAVFAAGRGELLCCNEQDIVIADGKFHLRGCKVNVASPLESHYPPLLAALGRAIPGLFGYVGVDVIETAHGPLIMEINPRLTTSYVGVGPATGRNVAAEVLALLPGLAAAPAEKLGAGDKALYNREIFIAVES